MLCVTYEYKNGVYHWLSIVLVLHKYALNQFNLDWIKYGYVTCSIQPSMEEQYLCLSTKNNFYFVIIEKNKIVRVYTSACMLFARRRRIYSTCCANFNNNLLFLLHNLVGNVDTWHWHLCVYTIQLVILCSIKIE